MKPQTFISTLLLTISYCLVPTLSFSQNFQYLKSGGGNNTINSPKEEVVDMATDSQRNSYVVTALSKDGTVLSGLSINSYDINPNSNDMLLVSYTCDGNYRWHKVFGGGGPESIAGVEVDSQDNVYIVGGFNQCSNPGPSNPYYSIPRIGDNTGIDFTSTSTQDFCQKAFRAKFNSNGVFQWLFYLQPATTISLANSTFIRDVYMVNDVLHCIASLPPGTYEGGAINNTNTSVPFLYYLLKYDTSGNLISATPFDFLLSNYTSEVLRWYRNPHNGNYYVVQRNNTNSITMIAGGISLNAALPKILCFNETGQYQWHREPSGNQVSFTSINFDPNNNIYVAGIANNFTAHSFLGWNLPGSNTGVASFIMKCNPDATSYSWVTHHNILASTGGLAIQYTPSVLYYAGSIANNPLTWGTQSIAGPGANNSFDPLLARFDPATGACLGLQRLAGTNGYADTFTHIEQDAAGDLILGGFMGYDLTDSNGISSFSNGGNSDFFIAKYATQACQPLSTENFEGLNLQLFPNPVRTEFTVTVKENTNYQFYTLTGVLIEDGSLSETENTISIAHLPSGCYVLKLKSETGKTNSIKVIKE